MESSPIHKGEHNPPMFPVGIAGVVAVVAAATAAAAAA